MWEIWSQSDDIVSDTSVVKIYGVTNSMARF
jgi:hypothetical protein